MSKYEPLWRFLSGDGSECIQFSFERIEEILGFPMDHSFLRYKQEAEQYGYRVEKFRSKKNGCALSVLLHSDIIPLQIPLLSYII